MPWFEFTGASVITGLLAPGIDIDDVSATLIDGSGWPTGADGKVFTATLGDASTGQTEEKILCSARSGNILTITQRGYDGTPAQVWGANTKIRHTISAVAMAEMQAHVFDPTRHDHTQYLRLVDHAAILHDASMLGSDSVGTDELQPSSVTSTELAAAAVIAGKIAAGGISAANQFAAGVVDAAAIAANAVGPSEIATDAVGTDEIAALAVTSAKIAHEAGTVFTPTWTAGGSAPSLGNGSLTGEYYRLGRVIVFWIQLVWGSTTTGGSGAWEFALPVVSALGSGFAMPGLTIMNNSGTRFVGVNIVGTTTQRLRTLERVSLADVSASSPFTWGDADFLQFVGAMVAAS